MSTLFVIIKSLSLSLAYILLHAWSFPTITSSAGVKLLSTLTYSPQLLLLGESPRRKEREEEETDQ